MNDTDTERYFATQNPFLPMSEEMVLADGNWKKNPKNENLYNAKNAIDYGIIATDYKVCIDRRTNNEQEKFFGKCGSLRFPITNLLQYNAFMEYINIQSITS